MPVASPSRCPRCHRLQRTTGLCATCAPDKYRHPDAKRFYNSKAWKRLRDQVLSEEPLCRRCRRPGVLVVDHVVPLAKAWALRLERSNVQALCPTCHAMKTRTEDG